MTGDGPSRDCDRPGGPRRRPVTSRRPAGVRMQLRLGGDDVDVQRPSGRPDHRVDDRAADELVDPAPVGGAHHQLGGVLGSGHLHQGGCHVGADHLDVAPAEVVEEGTVLDETVVPRPGERVVGADVDPDQLGLGPHGHAGGPADEHGAAPRAGERDHHPLLGLPRPDDVVALAVVVELLVHPVGDPQQGQLPQRGEVAGAEVVPEGGVDALGRIDVAVGQPPAQGLGGHVDQFDLVGGPHHRVGHRLLLGDPGDLLHHVVERLEVLEIDRRDDVDAGVEELLDVLPAFGVPRTGGVRVGELVDQHQLRLALEQPVEVHLLDGLAAVLDRPSGEDLQVADLSVGVGTAVVLHPADDHVGAPLLPTPPLVEHGEGLADTRGSTEIEPQLSSCHSRWPPDPRVAPRCGRTPRLTPWTCSLVADAPAIVQNRIGPRCVGPEPAPLSVRRANSPCGRRL